MKRPLLLMVLCFVLGEICIFISNWWGIIACFGIFIGFLLLYIRKKEKDKKWWFAPLFFIMGALVCYDYTAPRSLDGVLEKGAVDATAQGIVYQWEETSSGVRVYLQEVSYSFSKENTQYQGKLKHGLLVYMDCYEGKMGQSLVVSGKLQAFEKVSNPGSFDAYKYWKARNLDYQFMAKSSQLVGSDYWRYEQALRQVRETFAKQLSLIFPPKHTGVLQAMLLGDKSELTQDIKKIYQKAGIAHIIAISGLHIGFAGAGLFRLLRKCKVGYAAAAFCAAILVISYGVLTGMSGSTKRAMIMLLVSFVASVLGKGNDLLTTMALAALLILLDAPMMLWDAGFLLSFGAVIGIAVIYPKLEQWYQKQDNLERWQGKWWKKIRQSFFVSVSVQFTTIPIIAYFYYEIPLYSILLNMVVVPLMSWLVPFAVLAVLLSWYWQLGASVLAAVVNGILYCYQLLSEWSLQLPCASCLIGQPEWWQIILFYIALAMSVYVLCEKQYAALLLLVSILVVSMQVRVHSPLLITMLDVGQGDGFVIQTASGKTVLMDGGSTSEEKLCEYTYLPYLKSQKIKKIDLAVISHCDKDHISAVEELVQMGYVTQVCLPYCEFPDDNYTMLEQLLKEHKVEVQYLSKGMQFCVDDVTFDCLYPEKVWQIEEANANSTNILLSYKQFSMLFTGDITAETEICVAEQLLQRCQNEVTVLKVAHHGSKNSTSTQFLDMINAKYAIISAGKNNTYGHPHKDTLERLQKDECKIYTTIKQGAVRIETDGENMYLDSCK